MLCFKPFHRLGVWHGVPQWCCLGRNRIHIAGRAMGIACNWERLDLIRVEAMGPLRPRNPEKCSWRALVKGGELRGHRASSRICFTEGEGVSPLGRLLFVACVWFGGFGWGLFKPVAMRIFFLKNKNRRVTLAFPSHLLLPTMSDSEIGGEPAISTQIS